MIAAELEVVPVETRSARRAFRNLPYDLYRDDARWVPPLRADERHRWSRRRNASLELRRAHRFLARRGHRVVGRVASVLDPEFARRWSPRAGMFGFFECENDVPAARALLGAAEARLHDAGCRRVLGPVNLTTNDEVGLLIDGFDSPPMLLSPYAPPYYADLVTAAGYVPHRDYHAYGWTPHTPLAPVVERVRRLARRRGVVVRASDPSRWNEEHRLLFELYNAAFSDVWGFVPLSWSEYRERAGSFRRFYRPELVLFAECGGRPAGFGLALPDVNELLAKVGGRLWPLGWLRLARGVPRLRTARFILLGVLPEFRALGVAVAVAAEMAEAARRLGIERGELSLVQAENRKIQTVIAACGGPRVKTYRLYEKRLGQ